MDNSVSFRLRADEALDVADDVHIRLSKYDRRHPQLWYERRIAKLAEDGQVRKK